MASTLATAFALAFLVSMGMPSPASGAPANDEPFVLEQADGTRFLAVQKGDEWNNRVETVDGFTVARGVDGDWYYVRRYDGSRPVLDPVRANGRTPLRLERHVKKSKPQLREPHPGEDAGARMRAAPQGSFSGEVLFILTEFNDRSGTTTEASWASFISSNVADFFSKGSHGDVSLSGADETSGTANNGVVDWVNVGYNHPNTGENTGTANRQLAKDAILAPDSSVDFSAYDGNSDGFVDADELAVVVIAAGYERSYSSAESPSVWGHKWSISSGVGVPVVDGVQVGAFHSGAGGYAQFGELHSNGSDEHQATMGIIVHELGHLIFGLPDLYDIDDSSSGIGGFGVMGGGSWGRKTSDTYSGETPVLPCAWTKQDRGWVTANAVAGMTTAAVQASGSATASETNTVWRMLPGVEHFLVENRQPLGYDRGLERWLGASFGGLAIWHIQNDQTTNENDTMRLADLEEADGTQMGTTRGEATDLWYDGNATTYDANSTPSSDFNSGAPSGVSATNVSTSVEQMGVDLAVGGPFAVPGLTGWWLVALAVLLVLTVPTGVVAYGRR